MAPKKKKKKDRGRRSKTPGQTSASDPNPTVTSPSASSPTGNANTTSPSSASPSAPPATTTPQLIPSAPPQPTSLLPSAASRITSTQPLPSAPPLPIQETDQERISCTSDGAATTGLAGPSTAPSASSASSRTPTILPVMDEFVRLLSPAVSGAMAVFQMAKEEHPDGLQRLVGKLFGYGLDQMESVLERLLGFAEEMEGDAELKLALESLANMESLRTMVRVAEMLLAERKKRHGSGGSCGGSKRKDGGPESGSGEGDGKGGGVSV